MSEASKFALIGWSDALHQEEEPHGVHVGLVLPGFVATEGFPAAELTGRRLTGWMVSSPEAAAQAIFEAGIGRRAERYAPRPYGLGAALRVLAPGRLRRVGRADAAAVLSTKTGADAADAAASEASGESERLS